jgi:hypothetical protein
MEVVLLPLPVITGPAAPDRASLGISAAERCGSRAWPDRKLPECRATRAVIFCAFASGFSPFVLASDLVQTGP